MHASGPMLSIREKLALLRCCEAKGCLRDYRRVESDHLPPGYEPGELPLLYGGTCIVVGGWGGVKGYPSPYQALPEEDRSGKTSGERRIPWDHSEAF
jgi:hypothetical protein